MDQAEKIKEHCIFEDAANQLFEKLHSELRLKNFDILTDKEFAESLCLPAKVNYYTPKRRHPNTQII